MTTRTITLRNTVSGVSEAFPEALALDLLEDPHYKKILVEVDSEKPEVLSPPYELTDDGNRNRIEDVSTGPVETIDDEDEIRPYRDDSIVVSAEEDAAAYDEFVDSKKKKD